MHELMILKITGNDTWRDEDWNEYDALPALPGLIGASSPKARGILSADNSVITIHRQDKMKEME